MLLFCHKTVLYVLSKLVPYHNKKKKKSEKLTQDEKQYHIKSIVGNEIGKKMRKGIILSIEWIGDPQTIMEPLKSIHAKA